MFVIELPLATWYPNCRLRDDPQAPEVRTQYSFPFDLCELGYGWSQNVQRPAAGAPRPSELLQESEMLQMPVRCDRGPRPLAVKAAGPSIDGSAGLGNYLQMEVAQDLQHMLARS